MWSIKQTPDGGLNIIVDDETVAQVAQRLMCWSHHDKRISYVFGAPFQYFHIPAEACEEEAYGELVLEEGGEPVICNTSNKPAFEVPSLEDVSGVDPNNCSTQVPAPTGLMVMGQPADTSVEVSWKYTGPPEADGFRVVYRVDAGPGGNPGRWQYLTPFLLPAYARSATLRGLLPGTSYEVAVIAVDKSNWVMVQSPLSTPLVVTTTGTSPVPLNPDLCASGDDTTPPGGGGAMELTATPTNLDVSLLVNNQGEGKVSVDWGDGTATGSNPGDGTTPATHTYAAAGTYTVTATDADDPTRTATTDVTVTAPAGFASKRTTARTASTRTRNGS